MPEEILIAADHAGFELKQKLEAQLKELGYEVRDFGTNSAESTDYPDYAHPLAKEVSSGHAKRGVLVCGTGLGMSYVANRYPNVRAAVVWSPEIAELARSHNDANVLVLPSRFVDDEQAASILKKWLETPFEGGRHERRVVKIEGQGEQRAARASKPKPKAQSSKPKARSAKPKAPRSKPKAKKPTRKGKR
ncbi:MAG: ribose 5-phosphate isomerase B [Gemmatimonadaceae bacterium]